MANDHTMRCLGKQKYVLILKMVVLFKHSCTTTNKQSFPSRLNVRTRWVIYCDEMFRMISCLRGYIKTALRRKVEAMTFTVGVGRHSNQEVHAMMVNDLRQFAAILGNPTQFDKQLY